MGLLSSAVDGWWTWMCSAGFASRMNLQNCVGSRIGSRYLTCDVFETSVLRHEQFHQISRMRCRGVKRTSFVYFSGIDSEPDSPIASVFSFRSSTLFDPANLACTFECSAWSGSLPQMLVFSFVLALQLSICEFTFTTGNYSP